MREKGLDRAARSARRRTRLMRLGRGRVGFTLVEMLVVLAIIGLVVGLVGPRVLNYLSESKVKTAQIQMENIGSALDLFYIDAGRYPTTEEGLAALVQRPPGVSSWSGPYLKSAGVPKDPWGTRLSLSIAGQGQPLRRRFTGARRPREFRGRDFSQRAGQVR